MKKVAILAAAVFTTLAVALLLWQFRSVVLLFMLSLAVAAMIREPVKFLTDHRVPHNLAIALSMLVGVGILTGAVVVAIPILVQQIPLALHDLGNAYTALLHTWSTGSVVEQMLAQRLPPLQGASNQLSGGGSFELINAALGMTTSLLDMVTQSLLVIFLAIYWSIDHEHFERLWLSLLDPEQRIRARTTWQAIESNVGAYLRSEAAQSLVAGLLLYAGFSLMGVKYPGLLAVLAALAWLVPIMGALLAIVPVIIVGLLSGPLVAAAAVLFTLAVLGVMEFYVERRLYQRTPYGSLLGLLVTLAMVDALGFAGLLLAPPMAIIVELCLWGWPSSTIASAASPTSSVSKWEDLHARLAELREAIKLSSEPSSLQTASLADRLEQLVASAEQLDT